jgi:hypothetical protein
LRLKHFVLVGLVVSELGQAHEYLSRG